MDSDAALEELMGQLGSFGKYQFRQHALHILTAFLAGMNMLSVSVIARTPNHRCLIEDLDVSNEAEPNFNATWLEIYFPRNSKGGLDYCNKYLVHDAYDEDHEVTVIDCGGKFVYDKSVIQSSRVFDWDMVCENTWQRAFIQSIYVFGVLSGALICGALADKFGRKKILCVSAVFQFLFAMIGPFISDYACYCVSLFFYGIFGSAGAFVTGFVLTMELSAKHLRTYCGTTFATFFAIGICVLGLWSYAIRDVQLLQTVIALHSLSLLFHWWLMDESIRWLWGQDRKHEAILIVRKGVAQNGNIFYHNLIDKEPVPLKSGENDGDEPKEKINYSMKDLFRTPRLRFRALAMAFNWFALALCFYGLAFNTGALPGDPYLVFFLAAAADIPGHLFVMFTINRTGRRALNAGLLLIGGFACIVTTVVSKGAIVTTIAIIAKTAMAGAFSVNYNYTAEMFPTVIRNSAVGLCSMASRLGGMLTPQIILLDSVSMSIPPLVFGTLTLVSGIVALFLPETLQKDLPQTLEDGENFGIGDTAFKRCSCRLRRRNQPQLLNREP